MNFNELVVVERSRLYDMEKELDQCKSMEEPVLSEMEHSMPQEQNSVEENQQPPPKPIAEQEPEPENIFLCDLIHELPVKSRESAKHILRHLFRGLEIGIDMNNYNILRYFPELNHRIRVKGSNIYDILYVLCKQAPPPMPQQTSTDHTSMPCGMEIFLEMLSKTGLGSNHIVNCKYRNLFLMYRKK